MVQLSTGLTVIISVGIAATIFAGAWIKIKANQSIEKVLKNHENKINNCGNKIHDNDNRISILETNYTNQTTTLQRIEKSIEKLFALFERKN
ncbi:MAG: hypothetical protein ACFFDN_14015 [Candidatus Hodarchaeota archaeon]